MTAVQHPSHLNVRQYSPPLRNIANGSQTQVLSSTSHTHHTNSHSLSNGRVNGVNSRGSDATYGFAVNGDGGGIRHSLSNQNFQSHAANGINGDGSHDSRPIHDVGSEQQKSRPSVRRTKSSYDGNSGGNEVAFGDGGDIVPDDTKDWGARHGFEEHYESEYVAQLENVSWKRIYFVKLTTTQKSNEDVCLSPYLILGNRQSLLHLFLPQSLLQEQLFLCRQHRTF